MRISVGDILSWHAKHCFRLPLLLLVWDYEELDQSRDLEPEIKADFVYMPEPGLSHPEETMVHVFVLTVSMFRSMSAPNHLDSWNCCLVIENDAA